MTDPVTITIEKKELDARLLRLAAKLRDPAPMLEEIGFAVQTSVKRNFSAGGRPTKWKQPLFRSGKALRDTGNLMGSITYEVQGRAVLVGTNSIYAKIHHYGGVIRAKNVKALPIPLHARAAKAQRNVKSVRDIPGLLLIPRKGELPLLAKRKGERLDPWFVLKRSVVMEARPFLMIQQQDNRTINTVIRTHVEK